MDGTSTDQYKKEITTHAKEIAEMHGRLHRNFRLRESDPHAYRAWQIAAEQLRACYDGLAFPGGAETATKRVRTGEPSAMEAAVCFLELRPYFFRSGYMFKDLLRACRQAPLTDEQRARFKHVDQRYQAWRALKGYGARTGSNV